MGRNNGDFDKQKALHTRKDTTVFDLDGTLAMTNDPKAHHKVKHEGFAKEAKGAELNDEMADKVKEAHDKGHNVVILTARSAHYRGLTKKWLDSKGITYDSLVMRPTDNITSDKKVKRELLEEDVLPKNDVKKAYDDKKPNRDMFKKVGIDAEDEK